MKPACAFDEAPLDHIPSENLSAVLGLRNTTIAAKLASSCLLRPAVNHKILSELPALPGELPQATALLCADLLTKDAEKLADLCRITTIMINHKVILCTTSGAVLRDIASWCGEQALLLSLAEKRFPAFKNMQVLNVASRDLLEIYKQKVEGLLLGFLPPAYLERLKLQLKPGELSEPVAFAPDDPDKECFLRYAALAREYSDARI